MKIILIGFMGAGKTSVAKILSDKTKLEHIELDELILKRAQLNSINDIFKLKGENYFRELEQNIFMELQNSDNCIISTGGGIITNGNTLSEYKGTGKVIFLNTDFNIITKRLTNTNDRPLFQNINEALILFNSRQELYLKNADIIIDTNNLTIEEVVHEIDNILKV
ncbi:MAG: shikimate kinase [Ignavibacteria bacterium]|nr:shikimate kinase [Bacteroidota bacterium]MSQ46107.1 shikimate kinase [Ignavibacteria bacterium]